MRAGTIVAALSISLLIFSPGISAAQTEYPMKPIQVLIGFPAGSATDISFRTLSEDAKKYLKQEIVVINKPGATGMLAATQVAKAKPDGYTLGACPSSTFTIGPFFQDISTDLTKESVGILSYGKFYGGIFVKADSPFKTLNDLLKYVRENPGKASYGHPGSGTRPHLVMAAIAGQEGLKMNFVPFAGDSLTITALLGGHITAGGGSAGTVWLEQVKAGQLRFLAVEEKMELFPDLPTIGDLGYPYSLPVVIFMHGPRDLPATVIKRLEDAYVMASQSTTFREFAAMNIISSQKNMLHEELNHFLQNEKARTGEILKKLGLLKK